VEATEQEAEQANKQVEEKRREEVIVNAPPTIERAREINKQQEEGIVLKDPDNPDEIEQQIKIPERDRETHEERVDNFDKKLEENAPTGVKVEKNEPVEQSENNELDNNSDSGKIDAEIAIGLLATSGNVNLGFRRMVEEGKLKSPSETADRLRALGHFINY
jgi:hypothetical protein